jgi:RNA polymerase subunit RPABC4/transcription elongation factor Spt4
MSENLSKFTENAENDRSQTVAVDDGTCPVCHHYNALLWEWIDGEMVRQCRDCKSIVGTETEEYKGFGPCPVCFAEDSIKAIVEYGETVIRCQNVIAGLPCGYTKERGEA